ncbi:MAG: methylated-DNA--[protein]-cysteine S-methyltransferase [Fusobacteriaceae bacterium]|nr:methylated-DNA--[protein]-cysteine S-methyltransferase [Fusobacteriaceae bacterium]
MVYYNEKIKTPIGSMLATAEGDSLTGLWFIGQKYFPKIQKDWTLDYDYTLFLILQKWIDSYFEYKNPPINFNVSPKGTKFQGEVWKLLSAIPHGKTTTYGKIAKEISDNNGIRTSPRAVGHAVGHNPISLVIPCHRVIGFDGKLVNYAGGIEKKEILLKVEGGISILSQIPL